MATTSVPSVDNVATLAWTELDRSRYNALPYSMNKAMFERLKYRAKWAKIFGKMRWIPNSGPLMKVVRKEFSPVLRQFIFPNAISSLPKKDIIAPTEMLETASLFVHDFDSPVFDFLPSFQDFLTDHISANVDDITDKIAIANDQFLRGQAFHGAPFVGLCTTKGIKIVPAPGMSTAPASSDGGVTITGGGITQAWLNANLPSVTAGLTIDNLTTALSAAEDELMVRPLSGSWQAQDNAGFVGMYNIMGAGEIWNELRWDPRFSTFRSVNQDYIFNGLKGKLFDRFMFGFEDIPIRIKADGTFPKPQLTEVTTTAWNYNQTVMAPDFAQATYGVAMLNGEAGYDALQVGPPPKEFASNGIPNGYGKMQWNGEIILNKNLLVPIDNSGTIVYDTNKHGTKLEIISRVTMGCIAKPGFRKHHIPLIYLRTRAGIPLTASDILVS